MEGVEPVSDACLLFSKECKQPLNGENPDTDSNQRPSCCKDAGPTIALAVTDGDHMVF